MKRVIQSRDGRWAILADLSIPSTPIRNASGDAGDTFTARGYVQTAKPAAQGGKANANGFRFPPDALARIAATFAGKPWIAGHDWGDPRARAGTITEARAETVDGGDQALMFDVTALAAWALEGLANGTIDRFSVGIMPTGPIFCTIHQTLVWDACWCCPGELITLTDGDGNETEVIAEWEYSDGIGLELSAVNVPAVDGTGIVDDTTSAPSRLVELAELSSLCGRTHRELLASVAPTPRPIVVPTSDAALARNTVLEAELGAARERLVVLEREHTIIHVDRELERVNRAFDVPTDITARLRTAGAERGREAFDRELALVEGTAQLAGLRAPMRRAALQSDSAVATNPGDRDSTASDGPDAFEANRGNPNLGPMMKRLGVTAAQIREHGSSLVADRVLPNLRELADNTTSRGDRMGVGK